MLTVSHPTASHPSRRGILGAGAVGALAVTASACGNSGGTSSAGQRDLSDIRDQSVRVWFMEGSISDAARSYLTETFNKKHTEQGNTLTIEIQPWDGIVSKLQTSLASASESPDLVETGNTQTSAFASVGAFASLDDLYEEVGGDHLIQSFVDAGSWDGTKFALPLYAGARGIYYRKDLFAAAGLDEPRTLEDFADAVVALGAANPDQTPGFSGMYLAAVDVHGVESVMFAGGGDFARKDGDTWVEMLTDAATVESLTRIQRLFREGTTYALDSQSSQKAFEKYFNENKVGVLLGTGNVGVKIDSALWEADKVAVMPLPGLEEGSVGKTFAGGSVVALAKNASNPELAREALRIIFTEEFQKLLADDGWVPGTDEFDITVSGAFGEISPVIVENSKLTPNTPRWGVAAGDNVIRDFFTAIAQGGDVQATAKDYGTRLADILNSGE